MTHITTPRRRLLAPRGFGPGAASDCVAAGDPLSIMNID